MRVFIPNFTFPDSFSDNVASSLEDQGHTVLTLGLAKPYSRPRRIIESVLALVGDVRPSMLERRIVARARGFAPDVVLGLTAHLHPETLHALKQLSRNRCILWWGDAPSNAQRWDILDESWSLVFIKDRVTADRLRVGGVDAHYLREAMNPKWHRPIAGCTTSALAVAGNYYAFRQAILARLAKDGIPLELYGTPLPRWAHRELRRLHQGVYVTRETKARIFGEALACLNTFSLAEPASLNCRAFEIAGCGGLQIIENRQSISESFEPGKEILPFDTYDELLDRVDFAMKSPAEAQRIRQAAARRAAAEHTYRDRLAELFATASL